MYLFAVDSIEETTTNPEKGIARLMYKATFKVQEPKEFAGVPYFDYYVIGSNDDPKAAEGATWLNSIGAKRFKRLAKAVLVPITDDMDGMISAIEDQRFLGDIGQEVDDGIKDPKYKGTKRNRLNAVHAIGTQHIGITGGSDVDLEEAPAIPATLKTSAASQTGPAPTAPAPTKVAASAQVPCPYCGTPTLRSEYMAHIKSVHPEAE